MKIALFYQRGLSSPVSILNPIDPNPAISGHAVFPQSGHIRPEKTAVFSENFHIFPKYNLSKSMNRLKGSNISF